MIFFIFKMYLYIKKFEELYYFFFLILWSLKPSQPMFCLKKQQEKIRMAFITFLLP